MKKKLTRVMAMCMTVLLIGLFALTGCGSDENFEEYMKGQPAMRSAIDTQLNILGPDAKASVQYKEDTAEITVTFYALTQKEIGKEETAETKTRCEVIMQDALDQYHKDTGRTASTEVIIYGHDAEKK